MAEPSVDAQPAWHVVVDGCTNFRDAGGWQVDPTGRMRHGRLYRSDDPVRLTARGRAAVARLGLVLAVDLRQRSQVLRGPGFLPADRTVNVALVDRVIDPDDPPTIVAPADIADLYDAMLDRSREPLGRVLDLVAGAAGDGPVLVHCAYGKDRAGLVTALVQAALGVPAEAIVADYARSHEPSRRRRAWLLAEPLPDDPDTSHVPELLFSAHAEAMQLLVDRVTARHGSLESWVRSLPIAVDTVPRLREALLDV